MIASDASVSLQRQSANIPVLLATRNSAVVSQIATAPSSSELLPRRRQQQRDAQRQRPATGIGIVHRTREIAVDHDCPDQQDCRLRDVDDRLRGPRMGPDPAPEMGTAGTLHI
jgi:hypothetical protein